MGIFDIFTGDSAKRAAQDNTERLSALKTEGIGYLNTGRDSAIGALDQSAGAYAPLAALGAKYGQGTDLYLDSLGLNGAAGNTRAAGAFQAGPGYRFGVDQSLDALDRRAASRGMLGSGNTSLDTLATVNGLANQEYGNWQNRLGGLVAPELQATGGATSGVANAYAAKAPVYTNDAAQRVNLASGVTNGINAQATQAANAEAAASGNIWGAGLSLASLAAGMPPGSFSLLGGGGGSGSGGSVAGANRMLKGIY